jgi:hypothetical protein
VRLRWRSRLCPIKFANKELAVEQFSTAPVESGDREAIEQTFRLRYCNLAYPAGKRRAAPRYFRPQVEFEHLAGTHSTANHFGDSGRRDTKLRKRVQNLFAFAYSR